MGNKTRTSPRSSPRYLSYLYVERDQILNQIREQERQLNRIERTLRGSPSMLTKYALIASRRTVMDILMALANRVTRLDARYRIQ